MSNVVIEQLDYLILLFVSQVFRTYFFNKGSIQFFGALVFACSS